MILLMKRDPSVRVKCVLFLVLLGCVICGSLAIGTIFGSLYGVPFVRRYQDWSIGVLIGDSPLHLDPVSAGWNPVLQASDVSDIDALFVADPFLLKHDNMYVMFFEAFNRDDWQGDIAMATSLDGLDWRYEAIVLDEPFHLSYPHLFQWAGETYMVPESSEALGVFLYQATQFPREWVRVCTLLEGRYVDPSLIYHGGRWWLFVGNTGNDILRLFSAPSLDGRFVEHPISPVVLGDKATARPGGRVLEYEGRLFRSAQDDSSDYGVGVTLFEIIRLSTEEYAEVRVQDAVASGAGRWNASGTHHLDAVQLASNQWLAVMDGWNKRRLAIGW